MFNAFREEMVDLIKIILEDLISTLPLVLSGESMSISSMVKS